MKDYLFHFSDFHLGKNIYDKGRLTRIPAINVFRIVTARLKYQSHSIKAITSLDNSLDVYRSKYGIKNKDIVGCAVTGDITTFPYESNMLNSFHYNYLTSKIEYYGEPIGLNYDKNKIIPGIGNHDKLRDTSPLKYIKSNFGANLGNDVNPETGKVDEIYFVKSNNFKRLYVYFCIDSNFYDADNIAKGEISSNQVSWFHRQNMRISDKKGISVAGETYLCSNNEIVKVVLLHHPPIMTKEVRSKLSQLALYFEMRIIDNGGERVINEIAPYVDIILCGHYHQPFFKELNNTYLLASGTTSESNMFDQYFFNVLEFKKDKFNTHIFKYKNNRGLFKSINTIEDNPLLYETV